MTISTRYLKTLLDQLALGHGKMAFVSGPRQVGKTFFSKGILAERGSGRYYNWDSREFKKLWAKSPQSVLSGINITPAPVVILDEIHKHRRWRTDLKGLFDTMPFKADLIVTGSAKLDTFKRGGDSLLGRYFSFRLHTFSVRELVLSMPPPKPDDFLSSLDRTVAAQHHAQAATALERLTAFGGFPEPYLANDLQFLNAWRQTRMEALVREDIRDMSSLLELDQVQLLAALLPERVGSVLSRAALREDLQVAYTTVSRWLAYLSAVYYFFEIRPFSQSIKRSLKKEGKLYLWDYSEVSNGGARFENIVAAHLLKACHYWTDAGLGNFGLHYLKDKSGAEIDFLITRDKKPWLPVEVKSGDDQPARGFSVFLPQIKTERALQIVKHSGVNRIEKIGATIVHIVSADELLTKLA